NRVGTDAAGTAALGNASGGIIANGSGNSIGDGTAANANTVAFNSGIGVTVASTGTGNRIRANSIFSNTGLGIDLNSNGVTANDVGDADSGANNLQNFPVITSAVLASGAVTINGTLNSAAATTFDLDFFASTA